MKRIVRLVAPVLCLALPLAACGVDGSPIPPDDRERPEPGVSFSGSLQFGVAGGSDGETRTVSRITD